MAEDINGFMVQIEEILSAELKFSARHGLQYFEQETFNKIQNTLSEMRRLKILSGEEYHTANSIYKHFLTNWIKLRKLLAQEPRIIAQKYIGKKEIRKIIFDRDKFCLCCGSSEDLTIDHIIPISRKGLNEISNLQTLCRSCNSKKGTLTIDFRKCETV